MDDRIWKWGILIPVISMGVAILSIIVYMLLPSICGVSDFCSLLRTILAIGPMLLIIFAAVSFICLILLAAYEVMSSERLGVERKLLWVVAFFLFPVTIALYYFIDRKNAI